MRTVALLLFIAACGGETPMLGGVGHPNNGAVAGGAAAAAAALTLADPHAADRKPEQKQEEEKRPIKVKEEVPASVFDRIDGSAAKTGSGTEVQRPRAKPATPAAAGSAASPPTTTTPPNGKVPVLPSPHDAIDPGHADANSAP